MVRYDTYCDTGITIRYVSRYIYYPLIYEMQNSVTEVPMRIYYNIWGNNYHDTIFSLAIRIVGAVYRYIVIHWWIVTSLLIKYADFHFMKPLYSNTPSTASMPEQTWELLSGSICKYIPKKDNIWVLVQISLNLIALGPIVSQNCFQGSTTP